MSFGDFLSGIGNGIEHLFGGGQPAYNAAADPNNVASYVGPQGSPAYNAFMQGQSNAAIANTPIIGGVENWINNSPLAPVANALGSVGAGYSSASGAHLGTAAPAPAPADPVANNAAVDNSTRTYMGQYGGTTNSTPSRGNQEYTSSPYPEANATNTPFMPANGFQPTPTGQPIPSSATGTTGGPASTGSTGTTPAASGSPTDSNNWGAALLPALGSVIGAGTSLINGQNQAAAATGAADTVAAGNAAALAQQAKQFEETRADNQRIYDQQQANAKPWLEAGQTAVNQLNPYIASYNPDSATAQQLLANDKGYQFTLAQGLKALQNSAAANGGLLSGNTLKGITDYSQGLGSTEYQNAFNRGQQVFGTKLNALQSTAGMGQTAVGQTNQAGSNYASNNQQAGQNYSNNATALTTGSANALAAGQIGAANSQASGYGGAASAVNNGIGAYGNAVSSGNALRDALRY